MYLSIIIPSFNECESIPTLCSEIKETLAHHALTNYEVLLIDDGSTDDSWSLICKVAEEDQRFRGIRFRKNFGKSAALSAGFSEAKGKFVFTLDADLQDDPKEIPEMLEILESGIDLISGWKKHRLDPWIKVVTSRLFNWVVSKVTGVNLYDHNCGLKGYRCEVLKTIRVYGELHRFIPVLAASQGFKISQKPINHRPRSFGKSKFGVSRFINGFLDLLTVCFLTDFSRRPLHVLGLIGAIASFLGLVGMLYLASLWILDHGFGILKVQLHQRPLMIYSVASFIFGVQMLSLGLLAELVTAHQAKRDQAYSIAETTAEINQSGFLKTA